MLLTSLDDPAQVVAVGEEVVEEAARCGMYYVNERWLGGLLTNFATIQRSLGRLRDLEAMATDGRFDTLSKKEIARNEKERKKLAKNLDGIRGMNRLPDALFVVDTRTLNESTLKFPQIQATLNIDAFVYGSGTGGTIAGVGRAVNAADSRRPEAAHSTRYSIFSPRNARITTVAGGVSGGGDDSADHEQHGQAERELDIGDRGADGHGAI